MKIEDVRGTVDSTCFGNGYERLIKMVWTCPEEVQWLYRQKAGTARQEVNRKSKEKIYGCRERGHEVRREGSG